MIKLKNQSEIKLMRRAGEITAAARALAGKMVTPGVTTREIDKEVHNFILSQGATPTFLGYNGYPASACISINDTVIHGIPDSTVIRDGDIVSIDIGATKDGYVGDCAATFAAGQCDEDSKKLIEVTRQCFFEGIKFAKVGYRLFDISNAIETYAEENGYSVVREFVGHGVGRQMHEEPEVPNYGKAGHGVRLMAGMTLAIEPMINAGAYGVKILDDGWTVKTRDGKRSAHYENTILITNSEPEILTFHPEVM